MPTLNWIGKPEVTEHHEAVPLRLLKCDQELSHGDNSVDFSPGLGNLLVEGDNLHALRSLLPYYQGKIKCITIDPPYNTGNEGWIYNDNVKSPQIQQWLGKAVDREDLTRHDKWLCMMYPRLRYHHELLKEDGAIFISIDDNEAHYLRALCDEIFGAGNFVANIVWQKRYVSNVTAKHLSDMHDFVICYAKNLELFKINHIARTEEQLKDYKNPDGDPRGPWRAQDLSASKYYSAGQFTIKSPVGLEFNPPPRRYWRMNRAQYDEWLSDNRIWFGVSGMGRPMLKAFLSEVQAGLTPNTWWAHEFAGHNKEATLELKQIFEGESPFDTPKPTKLIRRILELATHPGDIILDSFAGSGTTGHAIWQLNAENSELPERRFVLVEVEPEIARKVTRERLKRCSEGFGRTPGLGGEFRFCHLGVSIVDETGALNSEASWRDLAHFFYLKRFKVPLNPSLLDEKSGFVGKEGQLSMYLLSSPTGIGPLDFKALRTLEGSPGPKIVVCSAVCVPPLLLRRANIVDTLQAPYEVGN